MARDTLKFKRTEDDCIVPSNRKLNKDGYYRIRKNDKLVLYHRFMWEKVLGQIPDGHEVHHKCSNRACCNIDHLEILSGEEHTILTNKERAMHRPADIDKSIIYLISLLPKTDYLAELLGRAKVLSRHQRLEFITNLCTMFDVLPKWNEKSTNWKFISKEIEAFKPEEKEETKVDLQS